MYCNRCGAELAAGARFCGQCGRAVPGAAPPPTIRLERPRKGRKLAGVCAGIANNLEIDPTLVRILWLVLTLMFAIVFGVVAYIVAWILMPEEPEPAVEFAPADGR